MGIDFASLLGDVFETFDYGYIGFDVSSLLYFWMSFTAFMLVAFLPFALIIRAVRRFTE